MTTAGARGREHPQLGCGGACSHLFFVFNPCTVHPFETLWPGQGVSNRSPRSVAASKGLRI
jgi:hypothetical protein